jgi:hypothetical protein
MDVLPIGNGYSQKDDVDKQITGQFICPAEGKAKHITQDDCPDYR